MALNDTPRNKAYRSIQRYIKDFTDGEIQELERAAKKIKLKKLGDQIKVLKEVTG